MTIYGIADIKKSLARINCNPITAKEIVRQIWSTGAFSDQIEFVDLDTDPLPPPLIPIGCKGLICTQTVSNGGQIARSWRLATDAYLAALDQAWVSPDPTVLILRPDQLYRIGNTTIAELSESSQSWLAMSGLRCRFVTNWWLTGTDSLVGNAINWQSQGLKCALAFANESDRLNAQIGL